MGLSNPPNFIPTLKPTQSTRKTKLDSQTSTANLQANKLPKEPSSLQDSTSTPTYAINTELSNFTQEKVYKIEFRAKVYFNSIYIEGFFKILNINNVFKCPS